MYKIFTANSKTEKRLKKHISLRTDIRSRLEKLKIEPRRANDAHLLHGRLAGKLGCWLGANIRMIYILDDKNQRLII